MEGIRKIEGLPGIAELLGGEKPERPDGASFADALEGAVNRVDDLQKKAESSTAAFARGEEIDLHTVLLDVREAEIAFKAMVEVRNKLVDAYREILRMGV